ncbi:MAG TPA: hypothetical protein VF734_12595 [Pseudonocardiaceae bacterium]|jgi:hypothetical protein
MPWIGIQAQFVVAAAKTSHVRLKSSRDLDVGWEGLGFVVADALLEAVDKIPKKALLH